MNPIGVAGMPPGGFPMVNNTTMQRNDSSNPQERILQLNTYIYDYFLKRGYHDAARALINDEQFTMSVSKSPRHDGDTNSMKTDKVDGKDETQLNIPHDLPRPNLNDDTPQTSFLLDWFNVFQDIFYALHKRGKNVEAMQYLQQTQNYWRLRDQQQNGLLRQNPMMQAPIGMRNARPGMIHPNLQKTAMQNNLMTPQLAQLKSQQQQQQAAQMMQMQRNHSDLDLNGHRPQTPASNENAPSPSKRPRLDAAQVNGQPMAPNGRGQPIAGQPNQPSNPLLMQNGITPRIPQAQFQFPAQQPGMHPKMQVYNQNLALHHARPGMNNQAIPNPAMNPAVVANQSEVIPSVHDGQSVMPMPDYYNPQMMRPSVPPNNTAGSTALQDYQVQLILLEQQNKKRLILARQESENMAHDGQAGMPSQPGLPQGASPQANRAAASPNPNDQIKRGTPKLNQSGLPQAGLPGSPLAQGRGSPLTQGRGSPATMGGYPQVQQDMGGAPFFPPNGVRPPSSNPGFGGPQMGQPLDSMGRPVPMTRVPSSPWPQAGPQGPPMIPQQAPSQQQQQQQPPPNQQLGQPQPMGTPQERNAMPPPSAPAATAPGRTQPPSPQTAPAPPTPQQAAKAAPKGKKDAKDNRKQRPAKKPAANGPNNTAVTPSSEAEHPATPTPPTPVTPIHPNSFTANNNNKPGGAPPAPPSSSNVPGLPGHQPTSAPAGQPINNPVSSQQSLLPQEAQDSSMGFDPLMSGEMENLDFNISSFEEIGDFDFDQYINQDTMGPFFDSSIAPYSGDTVEAGTGAGAGDGL